MKTAFQIAKAAGFRPALVTGMSEDGRSPTMRQADAFQKMLPDGSELLIDVDCSGINFNPNEKIWTVGRYWENDLRLAKEALTLREAIAVGNTLRKHRQRRKA